MTDRLRLPLADQEEGFAVVDGVECYVIPYAHRLDPFLMSIVGDSDHWLFVSSSGGLTAGRRDATRALFPYETDDRLHKAAGLTGPVTVLRVETDHGHRLWEPFGRCPGPDTRRALAKSVVGDLVVFEEVHDELGLSFAFRWATSERFGFIRRSTLTNLGTERRRIELVDGVVDVLPAGLHPTQVRTRSNLTNAYRRSEVIDAAASLAVHTLESLIVDQATPAEALRATVTWSTGPPGAAVTVDDRSLAAFRAGDAPTPVHLMTARPGAHLVAATVALDPEEERSWHLVADVAQDQAAVAELRHRLRSGGATVAELEASVREGSASLRRTMAAADALQASGDPQATAHHFANVLFNVMRGGTFLDGYRIDRDDLAAFLAVRNARVAENQAALLAHLPAQLDRNDLLARVAETGDADLERLALEYLPVSFSRRHGDPSRPWNEFSIRVRDDAGRPVRRYEGNWRDIFQNWEALCLSFPEYLPGVIALFVDASTADGFNPYRISREGIDWEIPDPEDPWSNIGYWGDHQIVYLLRLLEAADRALPGAVDDLLTRRLFTYADVPYRLAPYEEILADPRSTIAYDDEAADRIAQRVARLGGDGRLLVDAAGDPVRVSLLEKLVVPALGKLSNLVPGGGIWMNTQRPEWNDANNALVGHGLSMVTLAALRHYLAWLSAAVDRIETPTVMLSAEVAGWLEAVGTVLETEAPAPHDPVARRRTMDRLGSAFSAYRSSLYAGGLSAPVEVPAAAVSRLCQRAIAHLDPTIRAGRRADGLFHAYNLLTLGTAGEAGVAPLAEMLEGQVAVLGAGILDPDEAVAVVDALYASALYRPDQDSFMLYPDRSLPPFLDKNVVPPELVANNPLLRRLVAAGDGTVIIRDVDGHHRFCADLTSAAALDDALDRLASEAEWEALVTAQRTATHQAYEATFHHHAYTGRSGTMYAYEGLGSVYWHMVSKLLVAVQECLVAAQRSGASPEVVERLRRHYHRIRGGLGFAKPAERYGAFPTDPYSHTPAHAGAQQPGMTGQVKEEILTRPGELGVWAEDGHLRFDPILLRPAELVAKPTEWHIVGRDGESRSLELPPGSLGLTVCQVPVIVSITDGDARIDVLDADGSVRHHDGLVLDRATSAAIFGRRSAVTRLAVHLPTPAHATEG